MSTLYHTWVLPYPVGVNTNHGYLPAGRGRRRYAPATVAYRAEVEAIVREAGWRPPAGVPLALTFELHPPDARKRDIDGLKLLQDALFDALGEDDARIVHSESWKHLPCKENPRVEVRLAAVMGFGEQAKETA